MRDPRNEREAHEALSRTPQRRSERELLIAFRRGDRSLLFIAVLAVVVVILDCCHWRPEEPLTQKQPAAKPILTRA